MDMRDKEKDFSLKKDMRAKRKRNGRSVQQCHSEIHRFEFCTWTKPLYSL